MRQEIAVAAAGGAALLERQFGDFRIGDRRFKAMKAAQPGDVRNGLDVKKRGWASFVQRDQAGKRRSTGSDHHGRRQW